MLYYCRFFIFILACCTSLYCRQALGCELKVRTNIFPPLGMKDANDQWQGMDIDFTKALLEQAQCRYTFVATPWARALVMMKSGQLDMMLNVSKTAERAKYLSFIGPQRNEIIRFVSRKGALPTISQWQQFDLLDIILLIPRNIFIGEGYLQALQRNPRLKKRIVYLSDTSVRIDMLKKQRIDGFFAGSTYLYNQLKTNPAFAIVDVHPLVVNRSAVYYAFSKASLRSTIIDRLETAYRQLAKTPILKSIEAKYAKIN